MPKAVMVLSSQPLALNQIAQAITASGTVVHVDDKHLSASSEWGQFLLYLDEQSTLEDLEEQQAQIVMTLARPSFALLEYSKETSLPVALGFLPRNFDILIADNFGVVLPLDRYVSRLQASPAL